MVYYLVGGIPIPLKNMKVRLDHHPSHILWKNMESHKIHVPNQPAIVLPTIFPLRLEELQTWTS